jgi:ATP-binding cassette subfamily B multidrug efflux pump
MKLPQPKLPGPLQAFHPLKEYFIQNRWRVAFGIICLLLTDFLQLRIPLLIGGAVDTLTQQTATSAILLRYALLILLLASSIGLFRYMWRILLLGHARRVEQGLRNKLYKHLQTLPLSFYHRTKTGDLMARAINDIAAIRMATGMGMVSLFDGLVLGAATIGFMIYINFYLTLMALIPTPFIIYMARILARRMSTGYERVQKTFSDLTERVREAFAGIRVIKAYCRESWEYENVKKVGQQYISENMNLAKTIALFFPMMAIFTNLGLAVVIWMGGRLTILGHISTGDFVAFGAYLNLLAWPMMAMGWVANLIQRGGASMRRINRILEESSEIVDPPTALKPMIKGKIEFKGLSHKYPQTEAYAAENIEFTIEAGQTVSVVGRVGSGKTTLLQAIPRLLNVPKGTLFIDDIDVRDLSLTTLRESIGFVTQETVIFADTVRNNVVFDRNDFPNETLERVLRVAEIFDEIQALDKGLDTLLGERGITLSGGQRQRLTIARALLADPPILILDDALSMVDTRTEERILNQILEFRRGKTTLMVSHRVSTIGRADLIAVLDKGQLVERGDHQTLMETGREYARLYERQILAQELEIEATSHAW